MESEPCESTVSKKKRRLFSDSNETESERDSPNRSSSCRETESGDSIKQKLPHDVSKWTEEHITSLSIVPVYDDKIKPLELMESFPVRLPTIADKMFKFLRENREHLRTLLRQFDFNNDLDTSFENLTRDAANLLLIKNRYGRNIEQINEKLDRITASDQMRFWFYRYEGFRVQFVENLYNMIVKRDLAEKKGVKDTSQDPLAEYDFQFLFQSFASMFGLYTQQTWSKPILHTKQLQLSEVEISGKADVLYCTEIPNIHGSLQDLLHIVAVCQVKRCSYENKQHIPTKTRGSESAVSSTSSDSLPPHIPRSLLGQHGGELLLYHQHSIMRNAVLGLIVQETKVTFSALEITPDQYEAIQAGRTPSTKPKLIFTRPYDFMIKEDRHAIIDPLLKLAARQSTAHAINVLSVNTE